MAWAAAAGSLVQGNQQANAAQDAANASAQGSRDAINANVAFFNQARQDNYGQMVTGNAALRRLGELYGLDTYTGQPSWNGVSVSGGETTTDRPSTAQRMLDPGGLIWSQESSTTPLSFGTGGTNAGTTSGGSSGMPGNIKEGSGKADYSSFFLSPDFLVRQEEGIKGLDRGAAARGRLFSGGADADRMKFSADLGAQGFGSYVGNLMQMAGFGNNAGSTMASAGMNTSNMIGNSLTNMGNARASGYAQAGNARYQAWDEVSSAFGDYFGTGQQRRNNPYGGG